MAKKAAENPHQLSLNFDDWLAAPEAPPAVAPTSARFALAERLAEILEGGGEPERSALVHGGHDVLRRAARMTVEQDSPLPAKADRERLMGVFVSLAVNVSWLPTSSNIRDGLGEADARRGTRHHHDLAYSRSRARCA